MRLQVLLLGSAACAIVVTGAERPANFPPKRRRRSNMSKFATSAGSPAGPCRAPTLCLKFSGFITAQFAAGNLWHANTIGAAPRPFRRSPAAGFPPPFPGAAPRLPGCREQRPAERHLLPRYAGWSTRANFGFDMASNTAYGPLIGHFDFNADTSNGFDPIQPTRSTTLSMSTPPMSPGRGSPPAWRSRSSRSPRAGRISPTSCRPIAKATMNPRRSPTQPRSPAASRRHCRRKAQARWAFPAAARR